MERRSSAAPQVSARRTVWLLRSFAVCALLTALAFAQEPGKITVDTKVDLPVNPAGWLERALHLWNPVLTFGQVQNQAYGYLWPMGPFFALGDLAGMPAWATQRLWWALLMCVAYTGIIALAGRLGIGTPTSRMIAGLAFALSPRILTELGSISVEAWPSAIAPWVLAPLVGLAKGAGIRRGVTLSALAVACAGGVNATAVFAVVPLALLWLVLLRPWKRALVVLAGWIVAVACATAWWIAPLLFMGSLAPPFLDYIETAAVTTRLTDLTSVLRGTSHWLAYLSGPYGPQLTAGYRLVHEPMLFAATIAVAALAVAGLARRGTPHRHFLVSGLLMGVALVSLGHLSDMDSGLSGFARQFLDGVGAPLRNVHKFDVVLRLPLALGLAHILGIFGRAASFAGGWQVTRRRAVFMTALAMAAIAGVATPALAGAVAAPGSFQRVPGYWLEASQWLNENTGNDHVLIVPAARFPHYEWGSPGDEITQPLLHTPWAVRNSIPLTPPGTIRLLDAIDGALANGDGSAGLADLLARSDVRYLLLRSDLNYGSTATARPIQVRQALLRSPGIDLLRSFGPEIAHAALRGDFYDRGLSVPVHALEVYEVKREVAPVGLYDASAMTTVVGGPESLLHLAAAGLLSSAPAVLAGDLGTTATNGPLALTDGLRMREVVFGWSQDNASATMSPDEPWQNSGPAHDYLPRWAPDWTTVARYTGIASINASSSWAQIQPLAGSRPEYLPYAAMDGNPATSWRTATGVSPDGQWLEVDLGRPERLTQINLTFDRGGDSYPAKLAVLAGPDQVTADVTDGKATVALSGSLASRVRVVITKSVQTLRVGRGGIGLAELEIPGVTVARSLAVPAPHTAAAAAAMVMTAAPATPACYFGGPAVRCDPDLARGSEDGDRIDRQVTITTAATYQPRLWVRPRPGPALDKLIDDTLAAATPLGLAPVVTASSRAVTDPAARPGAIIDGDPATVWYASPDDGNVSLRMTWLTPRTITGLKLTFDPGAALTRPSAITAIGADGTRGGTIDAEGEVHFDRPMRTSEVTILILNRIPVRSFDPYTNSWQFVPFGIGEIRVLPDPPTSPESLDRRVDLPCGAGPTVEAGGVRLSTRVSATLGDLVQLREIPATICGLATPTLRPGVQRIVCEASALLTPTRVALSAGAVADAREDAVTVRTWSAARRTLTVVAADHPRVLVVRENTNQGWKATMGGFTLAPIVLDGWQQGWFVPAGSHGQVVLTFEQDGAYRAALFGGGGLAAALVVVAALPARRREGVRPSRLSRRRRWLAQLAGAVSLALVGGPWAGGIAGAVLLLLAGYRLWRLRLSNVDRRRGRLVLTWLRNWLPPLLVCAAGLASWRSAEPYRDALPQLLALGAMVLLWLGLLGRRVPSGAHARRKLLPRQLDHVVADGGEHHPAAEHEGEDDPGIAGEEQTSAWPVYQRDHQRVP
jgi:arabinofuranan 3-O-arabinosyltransferase